MTGKSLKTADSDRRSLAESLRKLTPVQRLTIEALLASATRREALGRLEKQGVLVSAPTLSRWLKSGHHFRTALAFAEKKLAARVTRGHVIKNASELLEEAMTPRPILYKGRLTGHNEIQLGAALTANEQLGKAIGAFQPDTVNNLAILFDIDFSGRKELDVIDSTGEIIEPLAPTSDNSEWLD